MEIEVKQIVLYRQVVVYEGSAMSPSFIMSGVLNKEECFDLAQEFQEAIDSLTEGWETK